MFFFFIEMASCCLTLSSFCPLSYPLLLKCKECVSQSLSSFIHSHYLSHLSLSLSEFFTVPWHDQRQLCDAVWGIQEAQNIKPKLAEGQAQQEQRHMCKARVGVSYKQMNKLKRRDRERERGDFVSTFSTSMKGRKVSLWSPFLYRSERGRKGLHESCCLAF